MCIFQSRKFELYPDYTRIHLGYIQDGETSRQWHRRAKLEQQQRDEINREYNTRGLIQTCELAQRKAAERRSDYQS